MESIRCDFLFKQLTNKLHGELGKLFHVKKSGDRHFRESFFLGGGIPINSYHLTPSENGTNASLKKEPS